MPNINFNTFRLVVSDKKIFDFAGFEINGAQIWSTT